MQLRTAYTADATENAASDPYETSYTMQQANPTVKIS